MANKCMLFCRTLWYTGLPSAAHHELDRAWHAAVSAQRVMANKCMLSVAHCGTRACTWPAQRSS